ncbi:MAG: universal stress protein, partial [Nitrososphaeraceae archaeon]|nr:universal stress protein [Nitrososphaeraceae archaeon]
SPQPHEYANLSGLVTPKQIDKIINDIKKETNLWFNRIKAAQNNEKNKIEILTDVILTGLTAYGEITQYAETKKINLIVIGTKGKTKLKKFLLGSTASGVISYAHCPVLVVK